MTSVSTVDQYNHTGNHHLPVVTSARVVEVVSEVAIKFCFRISQLFVSPAYLVLDMTIVSTAIHILTLEIIIFRLSQVPECLK